MRSSVPQTCRIQLRLRPLNLNLFHRQRLSLRRTIALAGDEKALYAALARLRDLGVSDFAGAIAAADAETGKRTLEYLASRR